MGFFGNMMDEAGAKTGKAIGNALFGKYGADESININGQVGGNNAMRQQIEEQKALEQMRIDHANKENRDSQLRDLISITFDPDSPNSIIQTLTSLAAQIDMWIKNTGKFERHLEAAISKYDMGIAILTGIDPNNAMLSYFLKKKDNWSKLTSSKKKRKKITTIIMWFVTIVVVLIGILSGGIIYDMPGFISVIIAMLCIIFTIIMWSRNPNNNDD